MNPNPEPATPLCSATLHGVEGAPPCRQPRSHWYHDGNIVRAVNHRHRFQA